MASFTPTNILIFGGTGTIGRYIVTSILRAKPAFSHVSLFTSASSVATKVDLLNKWKSQGLNVIVGDLESPAEVAAAYKGADTVISALGRAVLDRQLELLRLAEESDTVKWFLPSEYGTDVEHNDKSPGEKPHRFKLAVRKYVRENLKKVKVTYVVTGPYFDMWVVPGKVGFCTMWDVGKFVVATLHHPEASFGKALKVQSFVVAPNEVAAEYEKQTGAKFKVTQTPIEEVRELEAKMWETGHPAAGSATLRRIWAEGGTLYAKNDNEVVGMLPEDLDSLEIAVRKALAGGYRADTF